MNIAGFSISENLGFVFLSYHNFGQSPEYNALCKPNLFLQVEILTTNSVEVLPQLFEKSSLYNRHKKDQSKIL